MSYEVARGNGKTRIVIQADPMGDGLAVRIFNEGVHIGAVAVGEYDTTHQRVSVSVITRLGHKDDAIAQKAAYLICKEVKKPVCVIAGAHIDNIQNQEIDLIQENVLSAVGDFLDLLKKEA
jgi:gallate decarboxylase subunit D